MWSSWKFVFFYSWPAVLGYRVYNRQLQILTKTWNSKWTSASFGILLYGQSNILQYCLDVIIFNLSTILKFEIHAIPLLCVRNFGCVILFQFEPWLTARACSRVGGALGGRLHSQGRFPVFLYWYLLLILLSLVFTSEGEPKLMRFSYSIVTY
jgi:hypothetical protein